MALIQDSPKKKQHPKKSTSCCLGCFGFSINNQENLYYDKVKYAGSKGKQSSCFCFKRYRRKQSPVRTVAVDIKGGAEKLNTNREIHVVKKPYVKTATTVNESKVSATCQTVHLKKLTKNNYDKHQDIILENRKKFDKLQHSSCQKGLSRSFSTTASTNNNASNLIGSPQDKHEISRTVSLPPPKRNNQPVLATNRDKVDEEKDLTVQFHGNFDSIIGMSILMVTLIIMLFCGKFCAIICTSVWFYFLPIIRAKNDSVPIAEKNVDLPCNLDVNSKEYKKKVVLHGLLERNHRNM